MSYLKPVFLATCLVLSSVSGWARALSPQDQVAVHDMLIGYEAQAYNILYYYASNANEVQYWTGRAEGLSEAANCAYFYDSTEQFAADFIRFGGIIAAMAEAETNPYRRANLNGLASGYNQAGNDVLRF